MNLFKIAFFFSFTGCFLLLGVPESYAQKLLDASGTISVVGASSGGNNTTVSVAYSIRQLKTTYDHIAITPPSAVVGFTNSATPLVRVKRSFDNALLDIGYDGNGNLDTVLLKRFVTGKVGLNAATNPTANGLVVIWYDQSGNSRDASVGSSQLCPGQAIPPFIVSGGVIERNGGGQIGIAGKNGGMLGDGGTAFDSAQSGFNRYGIVNDRTLNVVSQPRAWSTVGGPADGSGTYLIDRNGGMQVPGIQDPPLTCVKAVGNYWAAQIRNEANDISQSFSGTIPISINRSDNVTIIRSGNSYPMYINGVLAGTGTLSGNNSLSPVRIGYGCPYSENVYYGEFILFPTALSTTNLTALNTSQNNYFSLGSAPGTWTGATSTDVTVASNWSNNAVPDALSEVTIPSGTVNAPVITGGQSSILFKKLVVASGATLTINGNVNVSHDVIVNGAITGSGTLTMNGALGQTLGGTPSITISNLVIANTADTITLISDLNISGTLTVNSNTVLNIGATKIINSAAAAGTITGTGTVMVTKVSSIADFQSQYKFTTYTLSGLTVNYGGVGAQSINLGVNYGNLIVAGSGIKVLSAAITSSNVTGNITVNSGTLYTNNFNIGSPTNRTITVAQGAVLNAGTSVITFGSGTKQLTVNGAFQTENANGFSGAASTAVSNLNSPSITLGAGSTVEYSSSVAGQVVTTPVSYNHLILTAASKTISSGTLTVAGDLTIGSGATYLGSNNNPALTVGGNFTNNGTYTSGTGLVTFSGTGTQSILSVTTPLAFGGSVTFSGASSTATMGVNATVVGTVTVSTTKTLDLGTYTFNRTAASGILVVAGVLKLGGNSGGQTGSNFPTNFSTYTFTGGVIEYNGSNAITQTVYNGASYVGLTLTNGSGSGSAPKVSTANLTVTGTMTVNTGAAFSPAATFVINTSTAGVLTGTGTINVTGGAALATQYNFSTRTLTNLTVNYSGGGTIPGGTYSTLTTSGNGTTTILGGAVIITGDVIIGTGTTLNTNNNTLSVAGNWTDNGGAFIAGNSTVTFNGTNQTIGGSDSSSFNNLTLSNNGTLTLTANNTKIAGTLTVGATTTLIPDAGVVINSAAALGTITGTGTIHITRTTATTDYQNQYKFSINTLSGLTANYAGLGAQTINLGVNYGNIIVSGNGIKTLSTAVSGTNITGNITVNAGTLSTANNNIGSPTNRTITVALGAVLNAGTSVITFGSGTKQLTINGTFQTSNTNGFSGTISTAVASTNSPSITFGVASTVEYTASGAGQIVTTAVSYNHLVLSTASKTIATGILTVAGNLTIGSGVTYLGTTNNPALTVGGNFTNNGTYTSGTGLVTFNGTGAQAISSVTTPLAFGGSVIFSGASSTASMGVNATVVGTLTVSTTKTLNLGTYTFNRTAASGTLVVAGALKLGGNTGGQTGSNFPTNFSTYTFAGGVIEYNGSDAITQTVYNGVSYVGLTLTNGSESGTAAKISTGSFTVTGTMTVNALVLFTPTSGNIITGSGATLTGYGSIDVVGAPLATQYAFTTPVLTNLTVNYVGGGGTIPAGTYSSLTTSGSGITSLGGGVIVTGTVTIGAGTTLAAGTNSISVSGDWINNGTYTTGTAMVTFNGTVGQTIGGTSTTTFSSVTITNTDATVNIITNTNITGTFSLNGATTNVVPDSTVVINSSGAGSSTITGSGIINVTRIAVTADLLSQYKFNTYSLTGITVEYSGSGSQTINSTVGTYGGLKVSGSGIKSLAGNITVTNDITLLSSTVSAINYTITTTGNWLNNGVIFSGTGIVNLNGISKTISGTNSTAFPALVLGAGASYTMNNNNTCTGLTFTASGTASSFTHGTNNILSVNGSVVINQPSNSVTTSWIINAAAVTVTGTFTLGGSNTGAGRVASVVITTGALTINDTTTIIGSTTVTNTLMNMSGGAGTLTFGGIVTLTSSSTLNAGGTSNINYNGTVAQNIPFSATFIYNNLNIANTHASGATFGAAVTASNFLGNLNVLSGILNTNNVAVAMAGSRTITVADGAILNAGTTSLKPGTSNAVAINGIFKTANTTGFSGAAGAAISSSNAPAISLGTNSTIDYNATAGGQSVTVGSAYANLTLSNTSGNQTASGSVIVNGILTTTAGGTFTLGNNTLSGTLTSISHNGIITTTNNSATPIPTGKTWGGTVTYLVTTGGQTIVAGTYTHLTLSNTSNTNTAGGDLIVNGNFTTAAGTFAMSVYAMGGNPGTITNAGIISTANTSASPLPANENWGAGTVQYLATSGGQNIVGGTYTSLTMGNTSGTQTAVGNITATTLSNNTSGITLDMASYTLSGITTYTVNTGAILRTQNISAAPIPTNKTWGGTVVYDAETGGQTVMMGTYNNLTISNTSGTDTASGAITSSGTFTNTVGGLLDMRTYALSVSTVANDGTIVTAATGSPITTGKTWGGEIIYAGSGSQTIVTGNYTDLSSTSTGARILVNGGTIKVAGSFSPGTNAYSITNNTFEYNGGGAQTIAAFNYNNLTISGARNSEVINLEAGTIGVLGTFSITASAVGSYDVSGNTINFNGGVQTVPTATGLEYNNVTLSGTGAKTTTGITINGIFSIEGNAAVTVSVAPTFGTSATLQFIKNAATTLTTTEWPTSFVGEGGVVINATSATLTLNNNVRTVTYAISVNVSGSFRVNLGSQNHTSGGLYLGGVSQLTGNYTATTTPAYFTTGTGRIGNTSPTTTWTSGSGTTAWGTTGNWSNGVPSTTKDAIIPAGAPRYPTLTVAVTIRSLTIQSGGSLTTSGQAINIVGDYINAGGTLTASSSPITIQGTTNQVFDGFTTTGDVTVTNATGDVTFNGVIGAASMVLSANGVNVIANSSVTLTGALTLNNAATANRAATLSGSGSIMCASVGIGNGTSPTTNNTTRTHTLTSMIANLVVSGSITINSYIGSSTARIANGSFVHTSGTVSVGGAFTTSNANAVNVTTYTMGNSSPQLNLSGVTPFTISGTGTNTITLNGTGAIVNYNSTSAQTARAATYTTLKINNKNATGVTLGGGTTVTNLIIGDDTTASVFRDGGITLSLGVSPQLDLVSGTYNLGSGATATSWPAWTTANITAGTTVAYIATSLQTISTTPNYSNLTLTGATTKTIGSGTLTVGGDFNTTSTLATFGSNNSSADIMGNITGAGAITSGSGTIALGGNWTNNGVFTCGTGTVNYDGSGAQTVAALTYNNLILSNARTGSPVITMASGTLKVGGTFTPSATGVGSYTVTGNTLEYSGTGAQTITPFTYNNLTLSGTRGNGTITLGSGNISVAGVFSNTATGVGSYATTGNTFTYAATSGGQSVVPFVYNNLVLNNTTGTNTANGNIVVDGAFTTTAGGLLQLGTYTLSGLLTSITHNGTISTGNTSILPIAAGKTWGGTIVYTAPAGSQTIVAGTYTTLTQEHTSVYNSLSGNVTINTALNFAVSGTGKLVLGSNMLTLGGSIGNMNATTCFIANGLSNITINGSGALGSNLFLDQTSRGVTNRLSNLTYNRASTTITLGDTVEVTGTITPTAGTLETSDKLKLISNASGTARVAAGSGTYITGKVTVERYVPSAARRWRFCGSPVSGRRMVDLKDDIYVTGTGTGFDITLSNQASVYNYNEAIIIGDFNSGWTACTNINDSMRVGKGYRIFIRGDRSDTGRLTGVVTTQNAVTIDLTGSLNIGNITMPVTYTSSGIAANDGWNLLSNPYASAIDWNAIHDAGRTGVDSNFSGTDYAHIKPSVYIFNGSTNSYTSYNALSNSGTGNLSSGIIPAGAAFWVQAVAGSPSLTIKETYKTAATPAAVFKTAPGQFTIKLIQDSITSDEAAFKYISEATGGYDAYDIGKLYGSDVNIASIGTDGSFLSANCKPFNGHSDTIPLSLGFANSGDYKMEFNNPEQLGLDATKKLYLIDLFKQQVRDISATASYSFSVDKNNASTFGNARFMLVVGEVNTAIFDFTQPEVSAKLSLYPNTTTGKVLIHSDKPMPSSTELSITDLSGKIIQNINAVKWIDNTIELDLSGYQSGMYFISIEDNGKLIQTLKCIKQ